MISSVLNAIENGLKIVRLNTKLLLVAVLLFIFPLFFVWVTQGFFETSFTNIRTAEKQNIASLHDTLGVILESTNQEEIIVPLLITDYVEENTSLQKVRILKEVDGNLVNVYSTEEDKRGQIEESDHLFKLSETAGFYINNSIINGVRTWQSFSHTENASGSYYIFAEYSYGEIDSLLKARQQESYMGLTAIFIFLIALAYWLSKQISWEKESHELRKQIKDRDLFANMIAHEFRAPLTAIKGYASFLSDSDTISPDEKRFAMNISASTERLVTLVSDFLEVARLQTGKLKIDPKKTEITTIVDNVVSDLKGMAENKSLELVHTKNDEDIYMTTDANRLTQVLTNIISNAVKYTESGKVELECKSIPGEVTIRVKDTGMGISAQDQQKLFAPFTRVGGVDASEITGSGLGMWITRQLVEMLNGEIGVESIKGVGTHIVINFKTKL